MNEEIRALQKGQGDFKVMANKVAKERTGTT